MACITFLLNGAVVRRACVFYDTGILKPKDNNRTIVGEMLTRVQFSKTLTVSKNIQSCKTGILNIVKVNEMILSGSESKNLP